jgi:hypothetical protein
MKTCYLFWKVLAFPFYYTKFPTCQRRHLQNITQSLWGKRKKKNKKKTQIDFPEGFLVRLQVFQTPPCLKPLRPCCGFPSRILNRPGEDKVGEEERKAIALHGDGL